MRRMILKNSVVLLTFALSACGSSEKESVTKSGSEDPKPQAAHGHDDLFMPVDLDHEGYSISLGHHGIHPHAGEALEPAVIITKEGETVDDAKVFVSLLDADGKETLSEEVATVFEPKTEKEPAHYAQGEVNVPKDAEQVFIRYRIVLPGIDQEFSKDVGVKAVSH